MSFVLELYHNLVFLACADFLPQSKICDNIIDCPDFTDELHCGGYTITVQECAVVVYKYGIVQCVPEIPTQKYLVLIVNLWTNSHGKWTKNERETFAIFLCSNAVLICFELAIMWGFKASLILEPLELVKN